MYLSESRSQPRPRRSGTAHSNGAHLYARSRTRMASALPIADVFKGENVLRLHGNLMEHPCTKVRALTQVAPQRATSMPCLTLWIAAWRVHFSVYQRPHRAAIDSFRSGSGADIPIQRVGAETQLWPVAGAESAILRVRTQLQAHPRLVAWRACADCNRSRAANPHSLLSLQAARIAILTAATVVTSAAPTRRTRW